VKAARYIYFTRQIDEMVSFYRDTMGMKVEKPPRALDFAEEDWVQLSSGGVEIAIHRAGNPGCPDRNRNKLVFVVGDVAATREKLAELGVRMGKHHVLSQFECCDFKDPDGNVLQISSR
jgi:catechol 2,3-dioxygenase-like lactoylglutathione lyase family enzyme